MTTLTGPAAERAMARARPATGISRAVLRRPLAVAGLVYLAVAALAAIAAPLLAPDSPTATDLAHVLSGPSLPHPLGTDSLGRDVLSRLMYGGRITLLGTAEAVLTVVLIGVSAGLVSGYIGGWADRVISWLIDVVLAIPVIIILLVVLAVLGNGETIAMVTLGVLASPGLARVVRSATLATRGELYIAAARVAGVPAWRIITTHVLPRVAGPVIVQTSAVAGGALMVETGLGYLGLGVQPPTPTWGGMVADASQVISQQPWLLVPSGAAIVLAVLAFGLVGDAVRDATSERVTALPAPPSRKKKPALTRIPPASLEPARTAAAQDPLVSVRDATVSLPAVVVDRVSLDIYPGEVVGLVGESGCGKSITGRALMGLLPPGGQLIHGSIVFNGTDLSGLSRRGWRDIRGSRIALVSQEPIGSLDPVFTVGAQVDELVRRHHGGTRKAVRARSLELLSSVRLPDPETVARRYPHELSGGMAQRVAIAIALAGDPQLLIADEPTTALDVTVQAEILDLLRVLQTERGMSVLLISHDLGVIADLCQRAYIMYAGHVVEAGLVTGLFDDPRHPYTAGLLASSPRRGQPRSMLRAIKGTVPDPRDWPAGCHFAARCSLATAQCQTAPIPKFEPIPGHITRCLHHTDVANGGGNVRADTPA